MNLKNRLSSNFCFNQNMQSYNAMMIQQMMNFMNRINFINQLNNYNKMQDSNIFNSVKNLTLTFSFNNNLKVQIQCQSNDKMKSVIDKFLCKCAFKENNSYIYVFNGKKINDNLTVEESGLCDNGIIYVIDKKYEDQFQNNSEMSISHKPKINLLFTSPSYKILIAIEEDAKFSEAIRKFFNKAKIDDSKRKEIYFLYNGKTLDHTDDRKIKDFLSGESYFTINVIDITNIIGA
jgi:hypothetical protein